MAQARLEHHPGEQGEQREIHEGGGEEGPGKMADHAGLVVLEQGYGPGQETGHEEGTGDGAEEGEGSIVAEQHDEQAQDAGAVRSGNRPQLYAAYALYGVTAFKVYIFDLEGQHQLYRAFSLLIFAAILFVSSYFANRQQRSHA